jgi:TolB-like protein/tetratricopeptide (TPR) repeat protein
VQTQTSIAGDLSAAGILEAVERICLDPAFARATRLCRFLRHAVTRTLAGEPDSLKESLLGREVFDRGPEFDPKADPIVRIDARRLRRKLAEYYEGGGAGDAIRVSFHTGAYVPTFQRSSGAVQTASSELVLAVLPFRNLSMSVETEFFSEGLSEALLNAAAREPNTRVIARNSSFQWGEAGLDPATLRAKFAVQKIIKGSVQTHESECRIVVQLIDTRDSAVGWSREFRGDFGRWFDLQEEVCGETLQALRGRSAERRRVVQGSGDRTAYQLFLRGRHEMAKGNPERYGEVLRLFGEAVQRDPGLAPAWAGLAHVYAVLGLTLGHSPAETTSKAREYAGKALALNPDEPEARVTLGLLQLFLNFDFSGALQTFTHVLEIHGEHIGARTNRALYCLAAQGDLEEAEAEVRGILEVDPLNMPAHVALGQVLYFQRRFDEALEAFESVGEFFPEFAVARFYAMLVLLAKRDWVRALEAFEVQASLIPYPCIHEWAGAIRAFAGGDRASALRIIDRMEPEASRDPRAASVFVDACVRVGESDRAIAGLERMLQTRHFRLLHLRVDPAYDSLRGDSRFETLVRKAMAGYGDPAEASV